MADSIRWFDTIDSTNTRLLADQAGLPDRTVYAALFQTAGRGQKGNRWESRPGENLTFSILLKPDGIPAREQFILSQVVALGLLDFLRGEGVAATIKWPNDIYVGRRKICGMLVENGLDGTDIDWSVIGIGINLNQTVFPVEVLNPTSLKRLTGHSYELEPFLDKVCGRIEALLPELETPEGRKGLLSAYERDLYQKDSPAPYRDLATGEEFTGVILGITPEGLLRVEAEGRERTFGFKEIGYIL